MNETDSSDWPDDWITSADIEELRHRFSKVLSAVGEPIHVELNFTRSKAADFIATVRRAPYQPYSAHQLLSFCQYLAAVVQDKLGGRND